MMTIRFAPRKCTNTPRSSLKISTYCIADSKPVLTIPSSDEGAARCCRHSWEVQRHFLCCVKSVTQCDHGPNPSCSYWKWKQMDEIKPNPWFNQQAFIEHLLCARTGLGIFKEIGKAFHLIQSEGQSHYRDLEGLPGPLFHLTPLQRQWYPSYLSDTLCMLPS